MLCRSADKTVNGDVDCQWHHNTAFTLSNKADTVVLLDKEGDPHDAVSYGGSDGPDVVPGYSLELTHPRLDNGDWSNWDHAKTAATPTSDFGTPGAVNSVFSEDCEE